MMLVSLHTICMRLHVFHGEIEDDMELVNPQATHELALKELGSTEPHLKMPGR